jgi:hypothetical protein
MCKLLRRAAFDPRRIKIKRKTPQRVRSRPVFWRALAG